MRVEEVADFVGDAGCDHWGKGGVEGDGDHLKISVRIDHKLDDCGYCDALLGIRILKNLHNFPFLILLRLYSPAAAFLALLKAAVSPHLRVDFGSFLGCFLGLELLELSLYFDDFFLEGLFAGRKDEELLEGEVLLGLLGLDGGEGLALVGVILS